MTTWFDLPVEVKQSILEYVVSTIAIKFTPRHGGTRSSRAKEAKTADDESAAKKADAVSSLLLVSKRFLSYLEPEPALLSDAIISISEPRCLTHKIDKRFSNDVLAGIRELKITHDVLPPNQNRRPGATSLLPADHFLTTRMPSLQKITIHYVEPRHPWLNECQLSFQQALTVADGSPVPRSEYPEGPWSWYQSHLFESDDPTFLARRVTQSLFFDFLRVMSFRAGKYLFRFLNVEGDASTYERVLKWTSSFDVGSTEKGDYRDLHFSTRYWCVELPSSQGPALCPQRLETFRGSYYSLENWKDLMDRVNAIELDKYYDG